MILENNGIGYSINISTGTMSRLPPTGDETCIFTYLQVKEDGFSLYGFLSAEELDVFKILISIHGVGPKAALSILSMMSTEQIVNAVSNRDNAAFERVSGIGKKTAQRIVLELQDKINISGAKSETVFEATPSTGEKQDAIDALAALGYSRNESMKAVFAVAEENMTAQQIVKLALKKLY